MPDPSSSYTGIETLEILEKAKNYNNYLTQMVKQYAPGARVLDFGAGLGTFAQRLRDDGFEVTCVEPDTLLRDRLVAARFKALSDLESIDDNSVDFIFTFNVLEHIADDRAVVNQLAHKLKPSGSLLVYVPAFPVLWTTLDDQVKHYRRYRKRTLRNLLESADLNVEQIRYADSLGFVMALVFRILRLPMSTLSANAVASYDKWLFPISRGLDRFAHRWIGKNVVALGRKKPASPPAIPDSGGITA